VSTVRLRHRSRRQRGFSLLEVLLALLVLGSSLMATAKLLIGTLSAGVVTGLDARATALLADASELAAVQVLDARAIGQWQRSVAAALPAPANPLLAASVQNDSSDASGQRRLISLRWAEPGLPVDRQATLSALPAQWLP
jgi:prepilin-type N-terminal cleavage/methylation domain-containing protein